MAKLTWGRPTIKLVALVNGEIPLTPTYIDVNHIVAGSTALTTTKGTKREAPLEGGGFLDIGYNKSTYVVEFEQYAADDAVKPVEDVDGVVAGEYAIFIQPEDATLKGIKVMRSKLTVDDTFDASIGKKWKYTADVLEPASGNSVIHEVITFA